LAWHLAYKENLFSDLANLLDSYGQPPANLCDLKKAQMLYICHDEHFTSDHWCFYRYLQIVKFMHLYVLLFGRILCCCLLFRCVVVEVIIIIKFVMCIVSQNEVEQCYCKDRHTHLTTLCPGLVTTQVSQYQKDETNLAFTQVRDSEWQ